jgi:hypothetical protein
MIYQTIALLLASVIKHVFLAVIELRSSILDDHVSKVIQMRVLVQNLQKT